MIKQIILLALPLILQALKKNKAKAGSGLRVTDRTATLPPSSEAKPAQAKKRESNKALPEPPPRRVKRKPSPIEELHRQKRSDVIVTDSGVIVHVLPDDNDGSRHQRFLVEVDHTDITIKIAHNIDLAPRVPAREGDRLTFRGEYEYNELGGAFHWTHHDPKKWREGGWIDHEGKRYE
ncbi:MAG: DUF3465 domain-containing protein [Planctomycetota bacterium]